MGAFIDHFSVLDLAATISLLIVAPRLSLRLPSTTFWLLCRQLVITHLKLDMRGLLVSSFILSVSLSFDTHHSLLLLLLSLLLAFASLALSSHSILLWAQGRTTGRFVSLRNVHVLHSDKLVDTGRSIALRVVL